jgi:hypothetical protein
LKDYSLAKILAEVSLMKSCCSDVLFPAVVGREVAVRCDGGDITSDAGLLLVGLADRKLGLSEAISECLIDKRQACKIRHGISEMVRERVYAITAGYEDANDLDLLGDDPALKTVCGRLASSGVNLASQPTISRLENMPCGKDLLRASIRLAERVISQLPRSTRRVIIDVDPTDDPCHGQQQFEFFNGHYGEHCYLPLHVHITGDDGRQRIVASVLRPGNSSATKGIRSVLGIVVALLRERLPDVRMVLRADSAFGVCDVLDLCDDLGMDFVLGISANNTLHRLSSAVQMDACLKYGWEGNGTREYGEFGYAARTWRHERRVVVKAEITCGELNPRFVVTSLDAMNPESVYEFYCARGNQENRIKEIKLDLSSGRTSCHRFLANQFRLLLHTAACVLMGVLQEACAGTRWAHAQVGTLRLRLLKVGARVVESCRRIWFHLPSSFPEADTWRHIRAVLMA